MKFGLLVHKKHPCRSTCPSIAIKNVPNFGIWQLVFSSQHMTRIGKRRGTKIQGMIDNFSNRQRKKKSGASRENGRGQEFNEINANEVSRSALASRQGDGATLATISFRFYIAPVQDVSQVFLRMLMLFVGHILS